MLDGGSQAAIERDQCRAELTPMMRQLGHYVEIACEKNMGTLMTSGFVPVPTSFTPPQPLSRPRILRIKQRKTGELLVSFTPFYRKASRYDLRYAVSSQDGSPENWEIVVLGKARPAARVGDLTPGTTYVFQVRAFGPLGFSDWSDAVSRMCI